MNRTQAPHTRIDTEIPFIKPAELILENGLKAYLLDGGNEEIVKLDLIFHAGSYFQSLPLVAHTVANLLRSGTEYRTADKINETFDFFGTYYHAEAHKDILSFSIIALQRHFEKVLDLFREIIKEPVFPDHELEIFLKNQKQQHLINNQKVQHVARTYFNELLFGQNHPYGYRLGLPDFDKLERKDLIAFHSEYFHPGNAFCIVSGKLPPNIGDLLQVELGGHDWPFKEKSLPPKYMSVSASEKKVLVQKPNVVQSAVRIGRRLFNRTHPDYHKLLVTNTLLGGYFGSRLMQNIRQDKGYTYGVNSNLVSLIREGYFFIGTETGLDVCQKAIDEIYRELKKLRCIPASEPELNALKAYLSGDFLRSFDGPFAQSQRYKELLAFQLDSSHYDAFLKELKSITPLQIMQTAEKYLHEDSMIELVVGGK
jgi:zinc protease